MTTMLIQVAVVLLASQVSQPHLWADNALRVRAYQVEATVAAPGDRVRATAKVTFDPLQLMPRELVFYLDGDLVVDSVLLGRERLRTRSARVPYDLDNFGMAVRTTAVVTDEMMLDDGLTVYYSGTAKPSYLWFPVFNAHPWAAYPVRSATITLHTGRKVAEWCARDVDIRTAPMTGWIARRTPQ